MKRNEAISIAKGILGTNQRAERYYHNTGASMDLCFRITDGDYSLFSREDSVSLVKGYNEYGFGKVVYTFTVSPLKALFPKHLDEERQNIIKQFRERCEKTYQEY